MSTLQEETVHIDELSEKSQIAENTYIPFKIGALVNGVPVWLEAQIPYSSNLEEILHAHETLKDIFNRTIKLLEEKLP